MGIFSPFSPKSGFFANLPNSSSIFLICELFEGRLPVKRQPYFDYIFLIIRYLSNFSMFSQMKLAKVRMSFAPSGVFYKKRIKQEGIFSQKVLSCFIHLPKNPQ